MTNAIWYAIVLLMQIIRPDFGEIDVYHDSRLFVSAELSGSIRSGLLRVDGETVGGYESSSRYRQVYTIFPEEELVPAKATDSPPPTTYPTAKSSSSPPPSPSPPILAGPYASGNIAPFLFDFTSVLSNIPALARGTEHELIDTSNEGLSGPWFLRLEEKRVSLSHPSMGLVVIIHF